jgi:uncharacterized protein YndB with AHSA1/START domain
MEPNTITVQATIKSTSERVWDFWNLPEHITQWYFASPDWHAPRAQNDLRVGGKFTTHMAAKDGSFSFDFTGIYSTVKKFSLIEYGLADGRKIKVTFSALGDTVTVTETFDPDTENPRDMQRAGWQAILDNFKRYVESKV